MFETPDGGAEMEANLTPEELAFVVELGVNILLAKGAIPFVRKEDTIIHNEAQQVQ